MMKNFINFNELNRQFYTAVSIIFHPWKTVKNINQDKIDILPLAPILMHGILKSWRAGNETFSMPEGNVSILLFLIVGTIIVVSFYVLISIVLGKIFAWIVKRTITIAYIINGYTYLWGIMAGFLGSVLVVPLVSIPDIREHSLIPASIIMLIIVLYAFIIFLYGVYHCSEKKQPQQTLSQPTGLSSGDQ